MNSQLVNVIECYLNIHFTSHFFPYDRDYLGRDGYKVERLNYGWAVQLTVNARKVKINLRHKRNHNVDVILIGGFVHDANFIGRVKQNAYRCKQQWPNAPMILIGNGWGKTDSEVIKKSELEGRKIINQKIGYELAREVGATKYIQYSWESGRGFKILYDEIAFAYFSKLKDEEERREKEICEEEQIKIYKAETRDREKFYRDLLLCFFLACLTLIISMIANIFRP